MIIKENKLADVLIRNYTLIPVIVRFHIPLGIGDKTIHEICKETGINSELLLAVFNLLDDPNYTLTEKMNPYNVLPMMDYLRTTYEDYLQVQALNIERHIDRLIASAKPSSNDLQLLLSLFMEYKQELSAWIEKEGEEVFPSILNVYELFYSPEYISCDCPINWTFVRKTGHKYDIINEKLRDLNNLMIKYLKGNYDENIFYAVILSLNRLKEDMAGTQRLEEKILQPIVMRMEKEIRTRNAKKS